MHPTSPRLLCAALLFITLLCVSCGGGSGSGSSPSIAQPAPSPSTQNQWTWMSGTSQDVFNDNSNPHYGVLGVAASSNVPGGRNSSGYWTDNTGKFWLFGGDGLGTVASTGDPVEAFLNDVWVFDPATNLWTWVAGSAIANPPCTNSSFQCGVPASYGTRGVVAASNTPGGRKLPVTWTDSSGNLWLFGGYGVDANGSSGYLNDLWKLDPTTRQWTWISGSSTLNVTLGTLGVYGTKGVASSSNTPSGARSAVGWADSNGNLWLFGGIGTPTSGTAAAEMYLNDLWKFNIATSQWTWVSGSGGQYPALGTFGTLGVAAAANIPSGRFDSTAVKDSNGKFWLFGGMSTCIQAGNTSSCLPNELWKFDPVTLLWSWEGGSPGGVPRPDGTLDVPVGVYGSKGTAAAANIPGGRSSGVSWYGNDGSLWIFGGFGAGDSLANYGELNDLWKYDFTTRQWTWMSGTTAAYQGGIYGVKGTPSPNNVPGSRRFSSSWKDRGGNLWLFAGDGQQTGVVGGATVLNDLWRFQP